MTLGAFGVVLALVAGGTLLALGLVHLVLVLRDRRPHPLVAHDAMPLIAPPVEREVPSPAHLDVAAPGDAPRAARVLRLRPDDADVRGR